MLMFFLFAPIFSLGGLLLGWRLGTRQEKRSPYGGRFERSAVLFGVVGLVLVYFFLLTDPFLASIVGGDVGSYRENKQERQIINGVRAGTTSESACQPLSDRSLCYGVAAIGYRRGETCNRVGVFGGFKKSVQDACKQLVQDAQNAPLDEESCNRLKITKGWERSLPPL